MDGTVRGIHHTQVAMPRGREAEARAFYAELLKLDEISKPAHLESRGGCWFRCGQHELHVGIDDAFVPARRAHPALVVEGLAALRKRLEAAGVATHDDAPLPGYARFYAEDPFGNRVELLERARA